MEARIVVNETNEDLGVAEFLYPVDKGDFIRRGSEGEEKTYVVVEIVHVLGEVNYYDPELRVEPV